ncbi:MAG: Malonyl CoA-acyl carrier protein transacylase [Myxococcaceae bacterium]|nr:Malonyl CoA-acyl carrier protein transacylase [Myxococcaceae bacterium]
MSKRAAWLFPGQGTQRRGMGRDLFGRYPGLVQRADEILGYSVCRLCLEDPDDQLKLTAYCQPALYVVNALTFLAKRRTESWPAFFAGHSLGEFSALFAAGAYDFETGLQMVRRRGELMATVGTGSMLAVIGPSLQELSGLLRDLRLGEVEVANYNLPEQTVLAGPSASIESLADAVVERQLGRAVHLHVGGAFHSSSAEPAARAFARELELYDFCDPAIPTISNVTACPYEPGSVRELLAQQMRHAVRWVETMAYLRKQGVEQAVQVGPGRVLDGLWERSGTPRTGSRDTSLKANERVEGAQ